MKSITVPFISSQVAEAASVPQILSSGNAEWHEVSCNNWPEDFPYTPKAKFRIGHTHDAFLIEYQADEDTVRARYADDNGDVWTDSCMEFFLSPDNSDGIYYNLECSCIGTVLLGVRGGDVEKAHAPASVLSSIKRWASVGRLPFEERSADSPWTVALIVPFGAFWHHDISQMLKSGHRNMRANFYKCGDGLAKPHFLSWSPIENAKPNFHLPSFFGEITLEKQ